MPARSKSQQRLFGMVHAYNKGELHCGRALRNRVADLAKRISDDDARHFAETPHGGLPERREKRAGAPSDNDLRRMYDVVQADARLFRRLQALGLVRAVRAGRDVRNRIVHQPGYVPSAADVDRALLDYESAGRLARASEKRAQVMLRPDEVQAMYDKLEPRIEAMAGRVSDRVSDRSRKRRSFLQHVVRGTFKGAVVGAAAGGLGAGALGFGVANHAAKDSTLPPDVARDRTIAAGARCGLWGASRGALLGALAGGGIGVLNSLRE